MQTWCIVLGGFALLLWLCSRRRAVRRAPLRGRSQPGRHIPQATRQLVLARDGGCCRQCGSAQNLEFDHYYPFSRGGTNSPGNIWLLCRRCNRAKGARVPQAW